MVLKHLIILSTMDSGQHSKQRRVPPPDLISSTRTTSALATSRSRDASRSVDQSNAIATPTETAPSAPTCTISQKCRDQTNIPAGFVPLCKYDDFTCICKEGWVMEWNQYFDIDCVYNECPDPAAKREFIRRYEEACRKVGTSLYAPTSWATWASPPTSVQVPSTKTDVSAVAQSTTMSSNSTMSQPQSTSLADQQIPICGISKLCLKRQQNNTLLCGADDFDCICLASNSMANNTQFNQQCVFDECKLDIGREELLYTLAYHCQKVGKPLMEIPDRWAVYMPKGTFPGGNATSTPTSTSPPNSNSTLPNQPVPHTHLPEGAIAGIAIGGLLFLSGLATLLFVLWRARKKSQELTRKNAILVDRNSAYGASARIEQVMRGSGEEHAQSVYELGSAHSRSVRESVGPRGGVPRSPTTDGETLVGSVGGVGGGRADAYAYGYGSPGVRHSQTHRAGRDEEYYGKYPDSDVDVGGSTVVGQHRDEMWGAGDEREYYGKYEESGTGTSDTYVRGVRDSYVQGKAQEPGQERELECRSERGSADGPDGVRRCRGDLD